VVLVGVGVEDGTPQRSRSGTSVVKAKTAVSKPGTARIRTGGTSSTFSRATRERRGASLSRTSDAGPTVRKLSSASAEGETTLGAMPPETRPVT
jgi:hypothetical protein